jgi:Uma2 family endonuclease
MASRAPQRMTLAAFLEWDDGTDRRYQLVNGVPVMMAPATEPHAALTAALMIGIGSRLKRSCRVMSEAGITVPARSDTCYVADLAVTSARPERGRQMVAEPVLIVEVLSPAVGKVDCVRKVADYRTLPSVQEILIAFHGERRITLQRRTPEGWRVEDLIGKAEFRLSCCEEPIPLEALYRDLLAGPDEPETPSGA